MSRLRPIPGDPSAATIVSMFDMNDGTDWWLTAGGDYQTGAAETMRYDGANWQRVVMLEWPARLNKTEVERPLRLLIDPRDAVGLADVLRFTGEWMLGLEDG